MKHALAYFITARAVAAASLVAVSLAPAIAQSGSAPQILPRAVTLAGTVSVRELSAKRGQSADAPDVQNSEPIEAPLRIVTAEILQPVVLDPRLMLPAGMSDDALSRFPTFPPWSRNGWFDPKPSFRFCSAMACRPQSIATVAQSWVHNTAHVRG